jgi:hypothetical protein
LTVSRAGKHLDGSSDTFTSKKFMSVASQFPLHIPDVKDKNSIAFPECAFQKRRFAFQTFTEAPAATPSTLVFGIKHQPHYTHLLRQ